MAPSGTKTAMQPPPPLAVGLGLGEVVGLVVSLTCCALIVAPLLGDGLGLADVGAVSEGCTAGAGGGADEGAGAGTDEVCEEWETEDVWE